MSARSITRALSGAWALGCCLVAPSMARAHAPDTFGMGARGMAMGGAMVADANDFSASYYNPAGLALSPGVSVSLGYQYSGLELRIDGADAKVPDVRGIAGGLVLPGRVLSIPVALGVAVYLPDAGLSTVRALREETPRWELYDDRLSILYIAANLAVRPARFLALGGGVGFLAATTGRFGIRGTADILSPYESKLEHEVDADLTSVRYPQAGLRLLFGRYLSAGVAYRGEAKLPLRLEALLDGGVNFAGIDVPLRYKLSSATVDGFQPQQVAFGVSWRPLGMLGADRSRAGLVRINVDATWLQWSAYAPPTAQTEATLDVDVPPGVALELPASPAPTVPTPTGFSDRVVPRVGLETLVGLGPRRRVFGEDHALVELPLRLGYVYEESPVPPQTGKTNYLDADRHTVSFGLGAHLNRPGEVLPGALMLDLVAQLSVLPERLTEKASPSDFVGSYRQDGLMWTLGATLGLQFDARFAEDAR